MRVVVWDEKLHEKEECVQKVYPNGIANEIANGIKKEFYSDLFFLILYNDEKKRNVIFEQLIDSLLGIVKVKDVVL